jgi:D-methionine transport system substrate-binding protein
VSAAPSLPEKPRRRRPTAWIIVAVVVVIAIIVAIVVAVTKNNGDSGASAAGTTSAKPQTVSIGVADKSLDYWNTYVKLAKSKLNVTVKLVNFSDYSLPNPALKQGQIDINQFQHIEYLANYNVSANDDLQPIGATAIYPLPLYSTTVTKPSELADGAKIAIPNDAINEARALLVLQSAKLLTLKDGGTAFSTVNDITSHRVDVTTVDASQTANALQQGSVAAAIVNVNYATSAGLPDKDVIAKDDPSSSAAAPYVNVFATTKANDTNTTYLALAKLFQDNAVQKIFVKDYPNAVVKDTSAKDLQADLKTVEQDAKAAQQ